MALCDVDWRLSATAMKRYPDAAKYRDFRRMLEQEDKNIDAVTVSTPDHHHYHASSMAMKAVGVAAMDMIEEVRRQFRDIPELRPALEAAQKAESEEREPNDEEAKIIAAADGKAEYTKCVEISTAAAIRKMIAPGLMAVVVPVIVGVSNPGVDNLAQLARVSMDSGAAGVMIAPIPGLRTDCWCRSPASPR